VSADWFRKSANMNVSWAKNELFDVLWQIGTPESYSEMISIITPRAEAGDGAAMGRLGRVYRYGKGVKKDLCVSADWFRKSANMNVSWAKNALFDVLWQIGTPESYSEMIQVATDFANTGDGGAMGRLGRAYRDGKGVSSDNNIAAHWYTKAKECGVLWAEKELAELDSEHKES